MPPSWVGALAQLENMEKENHDAAMVAKSRSRIRGHEEEVRAPWYLFGLGSLLTHRLFLDSIVVSIPACHAGDRGSIPRRGGRRLFFSFRVRGQVALIDGIGTQHGVKLAAVNST